MLMTFKKKKKHLTSVKQGKNFRALLRYMISFDPHQNPMCLIVSLEQTVRLPRWCMCPSLCLECPFLQGCWETLTDLLKPSSVMTAPGTGRTLSDLHWAPKQSSLPWLLYIDGFLAIAIRKCACWFLSVFNIHPQYQNWLLSLFADSTVPGAH